MKINTFTVSALIHSLSEICESEGLKTSDKFPESPQQLVEVLGNALSRPFSAKGSAKVIRAVSDWLKEAQANK